MVTRVESILSNIALLAVPVILSVVIITILMFFLIRPREERLDKLEILWLLAFGVLGGISGAIAGASQEGIVGALITGILGIVSVLISYIFTKEAQAKFRAAAPLMIIVLLINALVGIAVGQNWRRSWDVYRINLADYRQKFDQRWIPVTRQIRLELLKKCIGEAANFSDARANCTYENLEVPGGPQSSKPAGIE